MRDVMMTTVPTPERARRQRPADIASRGLLLAGLALLVAACAAPEKSAPVEKEVIAFPQPPEEPRFYYERTFSGSADVVRINEEISLRAALTGSTGIQNRPFLKPFSVAVHKGRVFVSDTVAKKVLAIDIADESFREIGHQGGTILAKPLGMDVDAAGNLYVTDVTQQRVVVFTRDGDYVRAFGGKELLDRPTSVTVNPEGTRAYVVDTGGVRSQNHRVAIFDAVSGESLGFIGTRGSDPGKFNLPREIDMGPDGRLYVVDGGNFRVQVFEPDGTFVRTFGRVGTQFGQFARPKGIAVDGDGNIYVLDASFSNFQIFDPEGKLLMFIGRRGRLNAPAVYGLPAGIEVDEDGRVYVVDQIFRKVDVFRPANVAENEGYLATGPAPKK